MCAGFGVLGWLAAGAAGVKMGRGFNIRSWAVAVGVVFAMWWMFVVFGGGFCGFFVADVGENVYFCCRYLLVIYMESIREIYRIGRGPSSSHTMGPHRASCIYLEQHPDAVEFVVTLYGSLAATGRGHLTDKAIVDVLGVKGGVEFVWKPKVFLERHPNAMTIEGRRADGGSCGAWTFYSVGGGALVSEEYDCSSEKHDIYEINSMTDLMRWCNDSARAYWEYVEECEGMEIWGFLERVWNTMRAAIERGIDTEGILPGPLHINRKAPNYYVRAQSYKDALRTKGLVFAYALAVSEENASGGTIVTAPTCGSSGVIPAVLYYLQKEYNINDRRIHRALATAGLIGSVVKHNASISGAEVGCQGEVGVACAMAAAAAEQLMGGSPAQIEYAAEMGLEHHLGMTCDPVCGLVQIPCIERNAYAAARALDSQIYSSFTDGRHRVSFDQVVRVMKQTGHDLPSLYKETAEGGLATAYSDEQ